MYGKKWRCTFNLRSNTGGVDVSMIAEYYGGGGHERAAGFVVLLGDLIGLF